MFQKLKDIAALYKAVGQYDDIREEIDKMPVKNLLQSKTFWVNLLGLGLTLAGVMPTKWAAALMPVLNIGLRIVTNQPVTINPLNLFQNSEEK